MRPEPVATYRLQMGADFGFDRVAAVLPYLANLGVSHLYTSPYLQAAAGSTHGYDVVDPTHVSSEMGGAEAHARLCRELEKFKMGQMIDVVPNHMAIIGRQNPWWWDVLENGPSSRYAAYFDVDWESSEERWPNKVLLPVLRDHYGRVLEAGEICLIRDDSRFTLQYHEHLFPIDPSSLDVLLGRAAEACGSELLGFIAGSYARMPRSKVIAIGAVERRHHDKAVIEKLLSDCLREDPAALSSVDAEVKRINSDAEAIDALIDRQNYRLAFWRTSSRDLGYRRFFDIDSLVGLQVEEEEVFYATHMLPITWARNGIVHGLRIDHPDGLRDPAQYLHRLHQVCPEAWIVAEKILEFGEGLPAGWPVAGTTGYDFLDISGGLFVDPNGKEPLTELYQDFTGETAEFKVVKRVCKRKVIKEILGSELNRLTALLVDICERHRRYRDYTRHELQEALSEVAACFPVYRTYVNLSQNYVSETDILYVTEAIEQAVIERPDIDIELFAWLKDLLLLRIPGTMEGELAMRFQQLTGPVMAKGVEDTAFYRFHRLSCLNEVGCDPERFGISVEEFHRYCAGKLERHPKSLLATSTHDTKRSEDIRARLALLSEMPGRWSEFVRDASKHNDRHRSGDIPDRNTEYLFYQTLVGAWPIDIDRMTAYMEKAVCEAKVLTSWTQRNEIYEQGVLDFVRNVMQDVEFRDMLEKFVLPLVMPGRINSLAQTLIKLTAPGVPDIYQGTELWDSSLVDPDNRRPVDFQQRSKLLAELDSISVEEVVDRFNEGLPKLWLICKALRLHNRRPELFGANGSYTPVEAFGAKAGHVVAFMRGNVAMTVVPRLVLGLGGKWGDTAVDLGSGRWRNELTGDQFQGGEIRLSQITKRFPVGLLVKEE